MRLRDLLGVLIVVLFLALFVSLMNTISTPNAPLGMGEVVIIIDLFIALILSMLAWGPLVNGEGSIMDNLPFNLPEQAFIPLAVVLFVFMYVSGLGEILLHANEVFSPIVALTVAACILGGATWLDHRSPYVPDEGHGHEGTEHSSHAATEGAEHSVISLPGSDGH